MRVFKIKPQGFNAQVFDSLENLFEEVQSLLQECEPEDRIIIEVKEMTEQEFNRLPEFGGY